MAARMVADQHYNFRSDYKYLRACMTGLSLNPNYTMFYLLKRDPPMSYDSKVRSAWRMFCQSLEIRSPDDVSLEKISNVSKRIYERIK